MSETIYFVKICFHQSNNQDLQTELNTGDVFDTSSSSVRGRAGGSTWCRYSEGRGLVPTSPHRGALGVLLPPAPRRVLGHGPPFSPSILHSCGKIHSSSRVLLHGDLHKTAFYCKTPYCGEELFIYSSQSFHVSPSLRLAPPTAGLRGMAALPSQSPKGDLECFVLRSEKETCFFCGLHNRLRADQYYRLSVSASNLCRWHSRGHAHRTDVRALLSSAQWHV